MLCQTATFFFLQFVIEAGELPNLIYIFIHKLDEVFHCLLVNDKVRFIFLENLLFFDLSLEIFRI